PPATPTPVAHLARTANRRQRRGAFPPAHPPRSRRSERSRRTFPAWETATDPEAGPPLHRRGDPLPPSLPRQPAPSRHRRFPRFPRRAPERGPFEAFLAD